MEEHMTMLHNVKRTHAVKILLIALAAATAAEAQQPIIYPAKGQTAEQQQKDTRPCYAWAQQQTGVDPVARAQQGARPPPPSGRQGERARGAARGAVGGAAIGAIAGDTGKGAGAGAAAGTMAGGHRARQNQTGRNQQAQNQQQQGLDTYNRAYATCMSGRGYTVG